MGENICQRLLEELPDSERMSEISTNIQSGIESSMEILHIFMDNPLVLGKLLGGVSASYLRRFILRKMKRLVSSSQK